MAELQLAQIQQLKQQGLSNNQIISTLQQQGFHSGQIFEALNQASGRPGPQPLNNSRPTMSPMQGSEEEIIEAIIDEKWNDLLEDINRIIAWKDRTTQRVDQFEQQLKDLKDQFNKLHQAVIGKVGEYDQHILQVGAEIKAMEKVFSKVLPTFTENVHELSRVAETMKKKD
jgi:uncharacterized protein YoxC